MRSATIVRSLSKSLGQSSRTRFRALGECAIIGLAGRTDKATVETEARPLGTRVWRGLQRVRSGLRVLHMRVRLWAMDKFFALVLWWRGSTATEMA